MPVVRSRFFDWPGKGPKQASRFSPRVLGTSNRARITQQYLEIIDAGDNNKARVSQQYLEVVSDSGAMKARISQVYLEVICTFGTPPVNDKGKGKGKDGAPGQLAKSAYQIAAQERNARNMRRKSGKWVSDPAIYDEQHVPPSRLEVVVRETRTVEISPSGHTVRRH